MKHIIVTGAAGGIGQGVRTRLESDGHRVTGIDMSGSADAGCDIRADLTSSSETKAAIGQAVEMGGVPYGLVHLAGTNILKPLEELTDADWDTVIASNLASTFYVNREVLPLMAAAGGGRVINTSSLFGIRAEPNDAAYSAAKAGVIGLTRSLALEYADRGVVLNALAPGITLTDRVRRMGEDHLERQKSRIPLGRISTVEDLSATVSFLMSGEADFYTGQIFTPNGGDWMP